MATKSTNESHAESLSIPLSDRSILLADGPNIAWRMYHVLASKRKEDPSPELLQATARALVGSVKSQYQSLRCSFVAIAFDAGDGGRSDLYHDYKANRTHPPGTEGLIDACMDGLRRAGFPVLESPGFEADDVIATVSVMAVDRGLDVVISSNDKDLCQIVSSHVSVYNVKGKNLIGPREVQSKFGVPPELLGDYLALVGDSSDNVTGVPTIGAKTAPILLRKYKSLEEVLKAAPEMTGKRRDMLVKHAEDARIAREVVRLREVPMTFRVESMIYRRNDHG